MIWAFVKLSVVMAVLAVVGYVVMCAALVLSGIVALGVMSWLL